MPAIAPSPARQTHNSLLTTHGFAYGFPPFTDSRPAPTYLRWPAHLLPAYIRHIKPTNMETYNRNTGTDPQRPEKTYRESKSSGRVLGGLFIVAIGVALLARQAGVDFPRWIFSFETILIALGIYLGMRHSFRGFGWIVPILIGSFLLIDDFFPYYDVREFIWPLIVIGLGLFIIFRSTKKNRDWSKWDAARGEESSEDYLDSTVVFGGVKKNIISKNFRGGDVVTVFGGTEIILTQAELTGATVLELTQIFGGTKLIVPPHWKVQSKDLVAIFGGVDDKRPMLANPSGEDTGQVLILKGTCLFGGIDIKSF